MKRIYVQPLLRTVEMESDGLMATSPASNDTDQIPIDPSHPADQMESNHRGKLWGGGGIWK